jgi:DNA-directed RNA polymerase
VVRDDREKIKKIAEDPAGTVDFWKGADKPFRYVAACIELESLGRSHRSH